MEQTRGSRPQVERTACTHMELYMVVKDGLLCWAEAACRSRVGDRRGAHWECGRAGRHGTPQSPWTLLNLNLKITLTIWMEIDLEGINLKERKIQVKNCKNNPDPSEYTQPRVLHSWRLHWHVGRHQLKQIDLWCQLFFGANCFLMLFMCYLSML